MGKVTVLYIGRVGGREDSHLDTLQKRYHVECAASGKQGLELLQTASSQPRIILLDAASMRTPGERVCRQLREACPKTPILHIIPAGTGDIDSPAEVLLTLPFTTRKLLSSIDRLLKARNDEIIECGPFAMNVPQRMLVAHGHEAQLSPKVALLVEMFLRNPNTTFDRKTLMETIWQTDYLGDTRTLDVHIRWTRKALQNGSGHHYLRTVRGTGYRLDLPGAVPKVPDAPKQRKTIATRIPLPEPEPA